MLAKKKQKLKPAANLSTSHDSNPDTKKWVKFPPFARYFNQTSDPDYQKYKVDDINIFNGVTYSLYDFPTHEDKLKYHTHTAETCRTHRLCLESKNDTSTSPSDYKSSDQENLVNKSTILT